MLVRLSGQEFQQTPGDGDGQGSPACYSPWGHEDLDTTEQLNNNSKMLVHPTGCKVFLRTFEERWVAFPLSDEVPFGGESSLIRSLFYMHTGGPWRNFLSPPGSRAATLSLSSQYLLTGKWQPTPVFLAGESQGRGSLVGCCLWGRTESDTTEVT